MKSAVNRFILPVFQDDKFTLTDRANLSYIVYQITAFWRLTLALIFGKLKSFF